METVQLPRPDVTAVLPVPRGTAPSCIDCAWLDDRLAEGRDTDDYAALTVAHVMRHVRAER